MKSGISKKDIWKLLLLAAVLIVSIIYFSQIIGMLHTLWNIVFPLALGFGIAYVLNIPMKRIEQVYFPKSKRKLVAKTRRPVSIVLSILLIVVVLLLVVCFVLPQLGQAFSSIASAFLEVVENIRGWVEANQAYLPSVAEKVSELNLDWNSISKSIADYAGKGISGIFSSTFGAIISVTSSFVNLLVALVFAIYLLAGKERLLAQVNSIMRAFVPQRISEHLGRIFQTANDCFSCFISGQCMEAVIMGGLCTLGMWIFRFPYAATVSVFVGATALIPIFGAYLGAAVGAFLILMVDPLKAVLFIVYIIVLQQLENNLIYPRVVGTSIGLPGIWVLVAITIGGGLWGIIGMLLGVPLVATIYKLINEVTAKRLAQN